MDPGQQRPRIEPEGVQGPVEQAVEFEAVASPTAGHQLGEDRRGVEMAARCNEIPAGKELDMVVVGAGKHRDAAAGGIDITCATVSGRLAR